MRGRRRELRVQALPHGWRDVVRQALLFGAAYVLYELVRGLVDRDDVARATWDATRVIDLERRLHVFVEPAIQAWALHERWLMTLADLAYLNAISLITVGALTFIYVRRNDSFYFVRNMFMVAMAIALVGYVVYPTVPPRLMPQWGFSDPVAQLTGLTSQHGLGSVFVNPYAAIPSMHVCFALMIGWPMATLVRHRAARIAWRLYPLSIAVVVIVTGNHYLTDIVLGALAAGVSALTAKQLLARARPDVWAFGQATA
jgi:hypothetical protein